MENEDINKRDAKDLFQGIILANLKKLEILNLLLIVLNLKVLHNYLIWGLMLLIV